MSQNNIQLVRNAYAKFAAGDAPGLLDAMDENVRWEVVGQPGAYPTFGVRHGRAGAADFFTTLAGLEEITEHTPIDFHASGDKVIVFGRALSTVRETGVKTDTAWAHEFTLAGGKITSFREFFDTAQFVAARKG
jgi:ketosteroid isomerase-like protein